MLRILIFGSGAVGTLIGGLLANTGHQVYFIGRKNNIDALRTTGLQVSGKWGNHSVKPQPNVYESVGEIPQDERMFDFILITTKAFATADAVEIIKPLVSDVTYVITAQNGYGNSQLVANAFGWHRTITARVHTGVELREPGVIEVVVHGDDIRLGHYNNELPMHLLESIALTMREADVPLQATNEIEQIIWAKILYNASLNPLGAMLNVTYGALAENEDTRSIMHTIMDEAFVVTQAHGIKHYWDNADDYRTFFYEKMIPPTAAHYPSMRRDIERKRRTEVDALNGAIVQLGKEKGIETPVNQTITSLIHYRESQY
jgi:2-dehydropantoate 2-reductase